MSALHEVGKLLEIFPEEPRLLKLNRILANNHPNGIFVGPTINSTEARKIILRCQKCGRSRSVDRTKSDPVKAVEMVLFCPKCDQPGTFESPAYMDKNGKQIL